MVKVHIVSGTTPTHCQKVIARHIESHGYTCIINQCNMYLLLPVYDRASGIVARQITRVANMADAYKKMGY